MVSLKASFLSIFVMIARNREAAFQLDEADHDFHAQEREREIHENTVCTREIHRLTEELHARRSGARNALTSGRSSAAGW